MKQLKKVFYSKWLWRSLAAIGIFSILLLFTAHWLVSAEAKNTYHNVEDLPEYKVGLLLGTSKYLSSGHRNLYYKYRIDAAVKLHQAGKVRYILISGDNGTKEYNEPRSMKRDLVAAGIPAERIYLDYAGFRTLDSVVRAKAIFGQDSLVVISQQFHNERALFLAKTNDIKAVGFNAQAVDLNYGFKVQIREKLARAKMLLDIVFGVEPKFYGEPIAIGE